MIDVIGQIVAAGFLAGFNQDNATRVRNLLVMQGKDRAQRAEHRITVVGAAAAIELVAFETRDPRAVALGPTRHLRLLVEMAVEQHGFRPRAGDIDQDDRCAAGQSDDFERRAWKRGKPRPRPAREQSHGLLHMAVRRPVRVEGRRFIRDPDIFDQGWNNLVTPALIDKFPGPGDIHHPYNPD